MSIFPVHLRLAAFAACLLAFVGNGAATQAPATADAWRDASRLLISESNLKFTALSKEAGPEAREVALGRAVTLLNIQPKTPSNIEEASREFSRLARENPDDECGILSTYYRGRIEQIHRYAPDWNKAAQIYRGLYEAHPDHVIGQMAAVKYAIVRLFDNVPVAESRSRLPEIEAIGQKLSQPSAERDMHLALADYYTKVSPSKEDALRHLLAANSAGITRTKYQGDIWLRIADLATALGQRPLAIEYYRKFANAFQRDNRTYTVTQRLAELETVTRR